MDFIINDETGLEIEDGELVIGTSYAQMLALRVHTPKGTHPFYDWYGNPYRFVGYPNNIEHHAACINAIEDMVNQEPRINKIKTNLTSGYNYIRVDVDFEGETFELRI